MAFYVSKFIRNCSQKARLYNQDNNTRNAIKLCNECPSNHNTLNETNSKMSTHNTQRIIVFDDDWGHNVWKTDRLSVLEQKDYLLTYLLACLFTLRTASARAGVADDGMARYTGPTVRSIRRSYTLVVRDEIWGICCDVHDSATLTTGPRARQFGWP